MIGHKGRIEISEVAKVIDGYTKNTVNHAGWYLGRLRKMQEGLLSEAGIKYFGLVAAKAEAAKIGQICATADASMSHTIHGNVANTIGRIKEDVCIDAKKNRRSTMEVSILESRFSAALAVIKTTEKIFEYKFMTALLFEVAGKLNLNCDAIRENADLLKHSGKIVLNDAEQVIASALVDVVPKPAHFAAEVNGFIESYLKISCRETDWIRKEDLYEAIYEFFYENEKSLNGRDVDVYRVKDTLIDKLGDVFKHRAQLEAKLISSHLR